MISEESKTDTEGGPKAPSYSDYNYHYYYSKRDGGYLAYAEEFPGLRGFGGKASEALGEVESMIQLILEDLIRRGEVIPEPNYF